MPDVMADRRTSPRFPLIVLAQVTALPAGAELQARTSDVSRSGCYIDTLHPLPKGSQVFIRLSQKGEIFEAEGTVMYVSPGLGMGVQFVDSIPRFQMEILDRWLAPLGGGTH